MPSKRILLDKIYALDAENAILLKTNAKLVANTCISKRTNKQIYTKGQYVSKKTVEELKA